MFTKLFVGNLSFQATEEDVRELFQHAGTLASVRIVTDHLTGRSRGFGFVEMATREAAVEAIKMLIAADGKRYRCQKKVGHDDNVHACQCGLEWKQW